VLFRLVGQAGAARRAARRQGRGQHHLLQVALTHEADEKALRVVISRDAGDDGDLTLEVNGGGRRLRRDRF
jgi:hypothetical protein